MAVSTSRFRRLLVGCAMTLSLSACCTVSGVVVGGLYASSKNDDPRVQAGQKPPTPVGTWRVVGGAIGLALDIGFVALSVSQSSNSFGH